MTIELIPSGTDVFHETFMRRSVTNRPVFLGLRRDGSRRAQERSNLGNRAHTGLDASGKNRSA